MRASSVLGPLFFLAATALAQAVEEGIAPEASPPDGCETAVDRNFTIGVLNITPSEQKRETAMEASDGTLTCNLDDGVLRDQYGRTGSIVANRQFQFDGPPQAGAIYTGGFSVCQNTSLAIGSSTRWWRCMSGDFGNLYDESIGDQCKEIRIVVKYIGGNDPSSSAAASASTISVEESVTPTATPTASDHSNSSSIEQPSFTAPATGTSASPRPSEQSQAEAPPAPTPGMAPYWIPDRTVLGLCVGMVLLL